VEEPLTGGDGGTGDQETAHALGNSVGTVKSQTSRALGRLRAYLDADLRPVTTPREYR
jgi:DNA-directed RNA polymerase specialized sigma24 family protein